MLNLYPIKNSNRSELIQYICFLHNQVNIKLNKEVIDCDEAAQKWGGNCGCESNQDENGSI